MNDFVAWSGWALTIVFGAITVLQFVQHWFDRKVNAVHRVHVAAACESLQSVRLSCQDAIENGEIIKTDATRQFVRQIAWTILAIEGQLAATLESQKPATHS